jgi:hypothetical protein
VEKSEAELKERIVALEACEEDLRQRLEDRDQAHAWIQAKLQVRRTSIKQRLEDRDQAHAWIQAKLQVTFLSWRIVDLEAGKEDLRQRLDDRD